MSQNWRNLMAEINSTADAYLLCVSGGVDSMFLLSFFARNCERPVRVAHFNHGLRPNSEQEEAFVIDTCRQYGLVCVTGRGDASAMRASPSLEAEARRQRYEFFESVIDDREVLVTAHHANDQLETVLLRLMRGYPDHNLRMKRINGRRYKPLLAIPKETLVNQAVHRRIEWMEDDSNHDNAFERNWVRNILIPQMMERRNVLRTIALRDDDAAASRNSLTTIDDGATTNPALDREGIIMR